jgi:hypothetical protein
MTGPNRDIWLVGHHKIPALQRAKLPRYWREGAVEVRPFPAEKRLRASEVQGLSGEAVKGNPTTTVIPRVDESKPSLRTTEDLTEPYPWLPDPLPAKKHEKQLIRAKKKLFYAVLVDIDCSVIFSFLLTIPFRYLFSTPRGHA